VSAVSGIEMALRDIFGKALGPPVWRLLDGKVRERVPIYTRPRLGKQDDVYGSFDAGAGLGVKVDLEVAARHPYRRELFIARTATIADGTIVHR
jgi:L-alanine-DL-glutamate epimerase-like enolase superfamily enzyme